MSAFAEERDKEVRNILQSIGDLTNIMKDLSVLVIDQGTVLDRIDYNMEQVLGCSKTSTCDKIHMTNAVLTKVPALPCNHLLCVCVRGREREREREGEKGGKGEKSYQ